MISVEMDTGSISRLTDNLHTETERIVNDVAKRMMLCQLLLKREAMKITPWRTGNLAGSYETPFPYSYDDKLVGVVYNHAEYAIRVHEMPEEINWNKPGTGPKFLERPLFENVDNFLSILGGADVVVGGPGNATTL